MHSDRRRSVEEQKPSSPMQLLLATFNPPQKGKSVLHPNAVAFARAYHAIDMGTLKVNELDADADYALGEYLIHGGRVRFDLSQLSSNEQEIFYNYVLNQDQNPERNATVINRGFATHGRGRDTIAGSPTEETPFKPWGFLRDFFINQIPLWVWGSTSEHRGIHLPIGGEGTECASQTVSTDGRWGHMYIYKAKGTGNFMMIGIEGSAPQASANPRTKMKHSWLGTPAERSAFNAKKLHHYCGDGSLPFSATKLNWACVTINPSQLIAITSNPMILETDEQREAFQKILQKPPQKARHVTDRPHRHLKMAAHKKMASKINWSRLAIVGSILLAVIGIVLLWSPFPPGVSQALGALLAHLGMHNAIGTSIFMGMSAGLIGGLIGRTADHTVGRTAVKKFETSREQASTRLIAKNFPRMARKNSQESSIELIEIKPEEPKDSPLTDTVPSEKGTYHPGEVSFNLKL